MSNTVETLLIFAGVPISVAVIVAALVYAVGARHSKRYRPGRPFEFTPVWYLASPRRLHSDMEAAALTDGRVPGGPADDVASASRQGMTGGASDRW